MRGEQSRLDDHEPRDYRAETDVEEVKKSGDVWLVKSNSGNVYHVSLDGDGECECPDHEYRGARCKHIRAVEMANEAGGRR